MKSIELHPQPAEVGGGQPRPDDVGDPAAAEEVQVGGGGKQAAGGGRGEHPGFGDGARDVFICLELTKF